MKEQRIPEVKNLDYETKTLEPLIEKESPPINLQFRGCFEREPTVTNSIKVMTFLFHLKKTFNATSC